jgi:hypothetical protein
VAIIEHSSCDHTSQEEIVIACLVAADYAAFETRQGFLQHRGSATGAVHVEAFKRWLVGREAPAEMHDHVSLAVVKHVQRERRVAREPLGDGAVSPNGHADARRFESALLYPARQYPGFGSAPTGCQNEETARHAPQSGSQLLFRVPLAHSLLLLGQQLLHQFLDLVVRKVILELFLDLAVPVKNKHAGRAVETEFFLPDFGLLIEYEIGKRGPLRL